MSISSAPSRKTRSSAPDFAMSVADKPPGPGTKPRSSAPRRAPPGGQEAVAVPALLHGTELDRGLGGQRRDGGAVGTRQRAAPEEDQRMRGLLEDVRKGMPPGRDLRQRIGAGA